MKQLIVIEGPTASGKTSVSVALAKYFNTCILSADSRQFYREIEIGTAKPSILEQDGITHFFINSHNLTDEVSSAQYEREALQILEKEFKTKDIILLVGGSGMYIDALCNGLNSIPTSHEIKEEVQKEYEEKGLTPLLNELKEKDAAYFELVDQKNPMRVLRAIEVIRLTGKTFTELRNPPTAIRPFSIRRYVLEHNREKLYERIDKRVDVMIEMGLIQEAQSVKHLQALTSLNTVGYKELFDYFDGNSSWNDAIELIKRNTRRYAKRQITWFKKHEANWIKFKTVNQVVEEIIADFNTR